MNNIFILISLIDNQLLLLLFLQVFNLFFVKEHEKKHVVHCLRCARHLNKDLTGWICLGAFPRSDMSDDYLSNLFISEEYDIEVLCTIFDNFVLGNTKAEATPENPCKLAIMNNILKKDLVKMEVKEEVEVV